MKSTITTLTIGIVVLTLAFSAQTEAKHHSSEGYKNQHYNNHRGHSNYRHHHKRHHHNHWRGYWTPHVSVHHHGSHFGDVVGGIALGAIISSAIHNSNDRDDHHSHQYEQPQVAPQGQVSMQSQAPSAPTIYRQMSNGQCFQVFYNSQGQEVLSHVAASFCGKG